jgi:hypothetical protein
MTKHRKVEEDICDRNQTYRIHHEANTNGNIVGLSNRAYKGAVNPASIIQEAQVSNRSGCEITGYNYPNGGQANGGQRLAAWSSCGAVST